MSRTVSCRKSGASIAITDEDLRFYERVAPSFDGVIHPVSPPTLAPEIRAMRRMAWRNSNHLYRRRCDKTGASLIAGYQENSPYIVYSPQVWWGDSWDPLASGSEFDFSRPFFEQFRELQLRAPRPAVMNRDSENSEYCNYAGQNKNCYMANNGSWYNDNCQFGEAYLRSKDSVDCNYLQKSELCYEVMGGTELYECGFVLDCYHCASCFFSFNLRSCVDCILCSNLRHKTGYILNQPVSKAELAACREQMKTHSGRAELEAKFARLRLESIHPAVHAINCENSSGDYITNCKNVQFSFMAGTIRDGKYLLHCDEGQDMWDCSLSGYAQSELYYETVSSGDGGTRALFCSGSWGSSNVLYCDTVMTCNNCFGCVGLKREQYCILNRRYSKADYEKLVPAVIEHMRKTKEWGEFFPEELAPHAYNESHASDFYPLSKAEAEKLGYRWQDEPPAPQSNGSAQPPENVSDASDALCKELFSCELTGRPYRIIAPELELLQRVGIALPRIAPETRRKKRNALRNSPKFWTRRCCIGGEEVVSTFAPTRPENVCCEECYRKTMY